MISRTVRIHNGSKTSFGSLVFAELSKTLQYITRVGSCVLRTTRFLFMQCLNLILLEANVPALKASALQSTVLLDLVELFHIITFISIAEKLKSQDLTETRHWIFSEYCHLLPPHHIPENWPAVLKTSHFFRVGSVWNEMKWNLLCCTVQKQAKHWFLGQRN